MNDAELRAALREHAYLEGDFVLRSGRRSRYYLDKYRFETRPDLLRPLGERLAAAIAEHAPDAELIAGPELGAVALAAAASLESGLPVPDRPQGGEGLRHRQSARRRLRGGPARLPRRGRRHLGRGRLGCGRSAPRGASRRLHGGLRRRPRGGRNRRSRPRCGASLAPFPGHRDAGNGRKRLKPAWLSRFRPIGSLR